MTDNDKNPTTNHELPRPEPGSFAGSWGDEIMNDDLTAKLEERVPIVDAESELSTYEPYETAAFIASDTGRRFVGDGDAWLKVGDEDNPIQGTTHLEAVSAGEGTIGDVAPFGRGDRQLISNGDKTLYVSPNGDDTNDGSVGSELATIQEAVDRVPFHQRHKYTIDVADGTYDEVVHIPSIHATNYTNSTGLTISGDPDTPSNVQVTAFVINQTIGHPTPIIEGFEITGTDNRPDDRGRSGILALNCNEVQIRDVSFVNDRETAIEAYSSHMQIRNSIDFGSECERGITAKRGGKVHAGGGNVSVSGSLSDVVYASYESSLITYSESATAATGENGVEDGGNGGRVIETDTDPTQIYPRETRDLSILTDSFIGLEIVRDAGSVAFDMANENGAARIQKQNGADDRQIVIQDDNGDNMLILRSDDEPSEMPQGFLAENRSDDPSNPADGRLWYRNDLEEYRGVQNGTVVKFDTTQI